MSIKRFCYGIGLLLLWGGFAAPVAGAEGGVGSAKQGHRRRVVVDSRGEEEEGLWVQVWYLLSENPLSSIFHGLLGFGLGLLLTLRSTMDWYVSVLMSLGIASCYFALHVSLQLMDVVGRGDDGDEVVVTSGLDEGIPVGYLATILDLILLLLLLFFGYRGFRNGLVSQFFSTVATLMFVAFGKRIFAMMGVVAKRVWPGLDEAALPFAAFALMLGLGWLFLFVSEKVFKHVLEQTFMGYLDSLLGGALGVVQATFCLSALIWLLELNDMVLPSSYVENMRVYQFVSVWVPKCVALLQAYLPTQATFFLPGKAVEKVGLEA